MSFIKKYKEAYLVILSIIAYVSLGYFVVRDNFFHLFLFYSFAFIALYFLYNSQSLSEKKLFIIGVFFRLVFLFCLPFWSQDFYRFIWDGRLVLSGISPYLFRPNDVIENITMFQSQELYNGMGNLSASHFSNYPPINQFFFAVAAFFSPKSIFFSSFIFKIIILFSDIGIYHFGKKILNMLNLNSKNVFLYFLNPLVIIELVGNVHFEGVMLFFFILGVFLFFKDKWIISALFIALSISTKLLPLLLLPFFYQMLGFKKSIVFYTIVIVLNLILFLPFVSETLIHNYSETISLWFVNFEFNASFYYIFREIGYWVKGYNTIGIIGKITPIFLIVIILFYSLFRKNKTYNCFFINSLFALAIYFFLSTTIHPWYIINLLIISIFTKYRFVVIWSFVIVISYFAYSQVPFKENLFLIFLEYLFVFGYLFYELKKKHTDLF
ncbi:mannosyltransferase [Flavobacterium jejuense]|uniref:Mannosyltransferase n=1 Tax=Flavobacterium jejuense TaxID=1544455 RepID=A0ABX0IVL1_9FLAO|nr:mannosyltransferase [Flavobacterium jejuense]